MIDPEYPSNSAAKPPRSPLAKAAIVGVNVGGAAPVLGIVVDRSLMVSEEGAILGEYPELSKLGPLLPVSPGSLEAPPDEGWQG